jgi:hypothetical protein
MKAMQFPIANLLPKARGKEDLGVLAVGSADRQHPKPQL